MSQIVEGQFHRGPLAGIPALEPGGQMPTQAHSLVPRFYTLPVRVKQGADGFAFHDVEYVEILLAGDMKSAPVQKVTDQHRSMYPEAYEAFKRGETVAASGTPLEQWPVFTARPAAIQALKMYNIFTVEALAELSDNGLSQLHGAAFGSIGFDPRTLRDMAQAYVESRKTSEPQERLAEKNQELEASVLRLENLIAQMQGQMEANAVAAGSTPSSETTAAPAPVQPTPGRSAKKKD